MLHAPCGNQLRLTGSAWVNKVLYLSIYLSNVVKKTRVTNKSAPIPNMMKLSGLLRLAKYGLIAKVNASLYLLLCGDISSNPGPSASNLNNLNLLNKGLRFGQWNVNYFTETKYEGIKIHILSADGAKNLDILFIFETFFNSNTAEELYYIPGFELLRKDRNSNGGGILVYVNTDLISMRRIENNDLEVLWLQVCPFKSKRPMLFGGVYRPPNSNTHHDIKLADNIEKAYLLNLETIVLGDFNIDYLKPESNKHRLIKALRDTKLCQLVSSIKRPISRSCLDHIWSNKPERIANITSPDIYISDHLPVLAVRQYKTSLVSDKTNSKSHLYINYRNLKRLDPKKSIQILDETPWDSAFVFDDVEDVVDSWYMLLNEAINCIVPLQKKRIKRETQPKWMSPEIMALLTSRKFTI